MVGPEERPYPGPQADSPDFLQPETSREVLLIDADEHIAERDVLGTLDPEDAPAAPERVKKKLGLGFWIPAGFLALLVLLALAAPILPLDDPNTGYASGVEQCLDAAGNVAPCGFGQNGHLLGTDGQGRDMLSRTIWGARVSLRVGFTAVILGLVVGGVIGLVAGYFRRKTETALMSIMDIMLAFPALILALAIATFTDSRSIWVITLAIGIPAIPPLARLVRANTLVYGQREFVLAARTLGAKNSRIIWKEIVPNVTRAAVAFSILAVAVAIAAEGFLAYLGVSVAPPEPTWGAMINDGRNDLLNAPWISLVPATAMLLTILALNLAGDRLRQFFDVKESAL